MWDLLRIIIFLVRERGTKNIEKSKKTGRRKTLKNEEKENEEYKESQIITMNMNIFGFTFFIKIIFCSKAYLKKVVYTIKFY